MVVCEDSDELLLFPTPVPAFSRIDHIITKVALEHLGCKWSPTLGAFALCPPKVAAHADERSTSALPTNLRFAVIDDSFLARRALMHVLKAHLGCSPDTIERGDSMDQIRRFPAEVLCARAGARDSPLTRVCALQAVALHVDVVILDQHMVYDDGEVLGSTVARQLRAAGFSGMIVLHSADSSLEALHDPQYVDGWLEKTASRVTLKRNLSKLWFEKRSARGPPGRFPNASRLHAAAQAAAAVMLAAAGATPPASTAEDASG
jgi:CheY-like chemotaxis protein